MTEKEKIAVFLSTIDNPFDPHTQWQEWKRFDEDKGYYTSQYLARVAITSDELSDKDYISSMEMAIDSICQLDPLGLYKKVTIYKKEG